MEKRYVRRDGSIVWVNLTVSAVRDAGGDAAYLIAVGEDITAKRSSEEARRKSEYRFQRLVEYSPQSTTGRSSGCLASRSTSCATTKSFATPNWCGSA